MRVVFALSVLVGGCEPATVVGPGAGSGRSASAAAPLVPSHDPAALGELLAAVPSEQAPGRGAERLGKPTDLPDTAAEGLGTQAARPLEAPAPGRVGAVSRERPISEGALERRARRELYFPLVTRCTPKGTSLPPDAIRIELVLAPDGRVEPGSAKVTAASPAHAPVAVCMRKELAAISFRGPEGPAGVRAKVMLTAPSVD